MHDFQHATGEAMPELLPQLKAGGYKIVHMDYFAGLEVSIKDTSVCVVDEMGNEMVRAQDKYSISNNARQNQRVNRRI